MLYTFLVSTLFPCVDTVRGGRGCNCCVKRLLDLCGVRLPSDGIRRAGMIT